LKRRERLICFRLTDEEYTLLSEACERQGWQNLSSCIRQTVLAAASEANPARVQESTTDNIMVHLYQIEKQISYQTSLLLELNKESGRPSETGNE
jgi:hypothetical protein